MESQLLVLLFLYLYAYINFFIVTLRGMISDLGVVWIQLYSLQSIFFKQIKIKRRYLLPVRDTNSAIFKDDLVKTKYLFLFYSELPFWTIRMLCLLVLSCVLHVAFAQALLEDLPDSEQSILTFKLLCTWHYKVSSRKRCLIEIALYSQCSLKTLGISFT